jgi:hypothetical protein
MKHTDQPGCVLHTAKVVVDFFLALAKKYIDFQILCYYYPSQYMVEFCLCLLAPDPTPLPPGLIDSACSGLPEGRV